MGNLIEVNKHLWYTSDTMLKQERKTKKAHSLFLNSSQYNKKTK